MSRLKKYAIRAGIVVLVLAGLAVLLVGPWPTYSKGFENAGYYKKALAAIQKNGAEARITGSPGQLLAGWGASLITPPTLVPMAGYGDRRGKPAEGVHDDLFVKALALSDGQDVAVIVGADILLVPENVAELVREAVAKQTPLTANSLYFTASHTHDSVGAFGPGLVAKISAGKYQPDIPPFLADAFTTAIIKAYNSLGPAKLANGNVDAPEFIRNRVREAPVDTELSYMLVEKDSGERCYVVNYSAHPTTVGGDFMLYTGEYPGFLQRALEREGAAAMYVGGALGSSGPRAPEGASDVDRAQAMGEALAKRVLDASVQPQFRTNLDIAAVGVGFDLPPFQLRLSPRWRLSPFLPPILGVDRDGWMHAVRIGDILLVGAPGDFSGEISLKWKKWAAERGYTMWTSSFSADYAGYISPDQYYDDADAVGEYETGLMSWTGPHQEAFFTALMEHLVEAVGPAQKPTATSQAAQENAAQENAAQENAAHENAAQENAAQENAAQENAAQPGETVTANAG
ncbi:MAG TPA: neutral/alkaline non-lysosomal ceramidase N-terminal domain-containing protein [Candidatus Bathyarchaeia archaeon]|nr:neutral/alkaline non-lysosomal ceramidase N-terminal domain-containing protein [Candidatus Bathyarchaeia archaeon]